MNLAKTAPATATRYDEALTLLESLIIDNPDFDRLEALLAQFNIFESIGVVRQELRHSNFLAFLLDPHQPHGLGDTFAKRLLQRAVSRRRGDIPVSPIDLHLWSLDGMLVLREWERIDILLLDESNGFAVIIENKIDSGEHSDQLVRYRHAVERHYPNARTIGLYLTPDGDPPSDPFYTSVSYGLVADLVEELVRSRSSSLGHDVATLMTHYAHALRRHIVGDTEIAELCRRVYAKHQRALDLIFEHRPDQLSVIREALEKIISEGPDLVLEPSSKTYIRFASRAWHISELQTENREWAGSSRILLFTFENRLESLKLKLIIGPGPADTRQRLFDAYRRLRTFGNANRSLFPKFQTVYSYTILTGRAFENGSTDDIDREIRSKWHQFLRDDFPKLVEIGVKSAAGPSPIQGPIANEG